MLTHVDGRMHPIITVHDQVFLGIVFVYITISTVYWMAAWSGEESNAGDVTDDKVVLVEDDGTPQEPGSGNATEATKTEDVTPAPTSSGTQRDGLNSMLASIQLATCVLYGTADNVYVSGIFFVLLFRCMQKLHAAHYNPEEWTIYANSVIVMDISYTAIVFLFAVMPHYASDSETVLYAAAQYVICDTIASNSVLSNAVAEYKASMSPVAPTSSDAAKTKESETEKLADIGPANQGPGGP
jgi:hypothetical protein